MLGTRDAPGVPGDCGMVAGTLANASESFLLATVSVALEVVRAKLAAVSCWRTVVSLAAASARLSRAAPKRSMETGGAGSTECAPRSGSPPPDAWSWRWRLRWARWNATFHAHQVRSTAGRPSQSSTVRGKCWAARTAAEAIITSSTSAMGMPARFAFFCASSIMTMNWGMPSACT